MPLYHVWFATKRRKWLLQEEVAEGAKSLWQAIAAEHNIRLLECETMVDHAHLLIFAEDQQGLSKAMNLLKGASSRRLFQMFPALKLDAETNAFWQHRYQAKVVPPAAAGIVRDYIRTQQDRLDKYDR